MSLQLSSDHISNNMHQKERIDLACAFRWTARMGMHEAIANHLSLAVNEDSTRFLINPKKHFSLIKASDLLLLDTNDPPNVDDPLAPDLTAWGLHGAIHRNCHHARCVMHAHPIYSTVLASLDNSNMPPIEQNTATFYNRYVIEENYGGLALEEEGERCATMLNDPSKKVMIMGNHGIIVIGADVADAFNRFYYFERAAETYIKSLWTQKPLRILSNKIAEKTASELENYPDQSMIFFDDLKAILDEEEPSYRN